MRKFSKKMVFVLALAVSTMFTGCYFFKPLEAEVKVINNSSMTMYYMATYNGSLEFSAKVQSIAPGKQTSFTCDGDLPEAFLKSTTEFFTFYRCSQSEWEYLCEKYPDPDYNDYERMVYENGNERGRCTQLNQKGQNYTVVFEDGETEGSYSVEITY